MIIALSGFARQIDRQNSFEAGIVEHWLKPFEPRRLRNHLTKLSRSRLPQSPEALPRLPMQRRGRASFHLRSPAVSSLCLAKLFECRNLGIFRGRSRRGPIAGLASGNSFAYPENGVPNSKNPQKQKNRAQKP